MHHYLNSAESKLKDFKELSSMAWKYSKQINQEEKEKVLEQFLHWLMKLILETR